MIGLVIDCWFEAARSVIMGNSGLHQTSESQLDLPLCADGLVGRKNQQVGLQAQKVYLSLVRKQLRWDIVSHSVRARLLFFAWFLPILMKKQEQVSFVFQSEISHTFIPGHVNRFSFIQIN